MKLRQQSARHSFTVCVGMPFTRSCVTKTDKCNSSELSQPAPTHPTPRLYCEPARAWHEELQGSHVTRHTLTSVIRPAAIQSAAINASNTSSASGSVKEKKRKKKKKKHWWAILQTANTQTILSK